MTLSIEAIETPSAACVQATEHLRLNRAALANTQPTLLGDLLALHADLEWLIGRDGSLTARDATRQWLGGSSLPRRVALAQLNDLHLSGPVSCFIAPRTRLQFAQCSTWPDPNKQ